MSDPAPDNRPVPSACGLAELVDRHQTGVWRYLRALGAGPQLAEELLQDTFVVAWRRGLADRGELPVETFLRRTAKHLFLRQSRAQGRRTALLVELVDRLWQRDCESDQGEAWLNALRECTQQLEGRARAALRICYGPGAQRGDRGRAAAALGMKPNGLKTLLQRVRALLRTCIERRLEVDDER
ncbi:MAG TPA: sigma factor [Planctomycetota bacterium]|nr:sigma factor [Planctomycetota bacterium]